MVNGSWGEHCGVVVLRAILFGRVSSCRVLNLCLHLHTPTLFIIIIYTMSISMSRICIYSIHFENWNRFRRRNPSWKWFEPSTLQGRSTRGTSQTFTGGAGTSRSSSSQGLTGHRRREKWGKEMIRFPLTGALFKQGVT